MVKFCAKLLADGWLNPARSSESKFQETIVPRVIRVSHVPPRHLQSVKPIGRRFAALEPSGAAGWAGEGVARDAKCAVVKRSFRRETAQSKTSARAKRSGRKEPRGRHGISAREAADCLGNREPSTADRCAERVPPAGRDPKTPLAQRYAERARGADSRSRSNLTARGNHMPPHKQSAKTEKAQDFAFRKCPR